jgi:hypothetical protein
LPYLLTTELYIHLANNEIQMLTSAYINTALQASIASNNARLTSSQCEKSHSFIFIALNNANQRLADHCRVGFSRGSQAQPSIGPGQFGHPVMGAVDKVGP